MGDISTQVKGWHGRDYMYIPIDFPFLVNVLISDNVYTGVGTLRYLLDLGNFCIISNKFNASELQIHYWCFVKVLHKLMFSILVASIYTNDFFSFSLIFI